LRITPTGRTTIVAVIASLTTAKRGFLAARRRVTVPVLRLKTHAGQNETGFPAVDMATFS
jgi:hypothetical protein